MANVRELPDLVSEFIDMSKAYLRQETLDPAKQLGRFAGFAVAGAIAFAIGALLVSIAGVRLIRDALPEGPNWAALGYVIAAVVIAIVLLIIVKVTSSRTAGRS